MGRALLGPMRQGFQRDRGQTARHHRQEITMSHPDHYAGLNALLKLARRLSRFAMWVAGSLTLLSALYISVDVVTRKFFSFSLGGSDELSGYAFAISISWALSFATLRSEAHTSELQSLMRISYSVF